MTMIQYVFKSLLLCLEEATFIKGQLSSNYYLIPNQICAWLYPFYDGKILQTFRAYLRHEFK